MLILIACGTIDVINVCMDFDENLYVLKISRTIYGGQERLTTLLRQELISNLKRVQSINSRRIKEKQIEI